MLGHRFRVVHRAILRDMIDVILNYYYSLICFCFHSTMSRTVRFINNCRPPSWSSKPACDPARDLEYYRSIDHHDLNRASKVNARGITTTNSLATTNPQAQLLTSNPNAQHGSPHRILELLRYASPPSLRWSLGTFLIGTNPAT